jgi:cytidine deaminase
MSNPKSKIQNPKSDDYEGLIEQANQARAYSYAPYSQFRVGAALLARSGRVYTGCNIENAAYSPTICAERVALGAAIAAGEPVGEFSVIAVVGGLQEPTPPCGVCRQVLSELAPGIVVAMASDPEKGDGRLVLTIEELLPHGFTSYKDAGR